MIMIWVGIVLLFVAPLIGYACAKIDDWLGPKVLLGFLVIGAIMYIVRLGCLECFYKMGPNSGAGIEEFFGLLGIVPTLFFYFVSWLLIRGNRP